ncbi:MAG: DUF92 domain-containing protein, partial [Chloroflexota bacterium]
AFLAYRARSLSLSGALAAVGVGAVIFGIGGWEWAALLLAFFVSSSGLTKAFGKRKNKFDEKFAKGGQRDAGQVLGNGAVATLFAALHGLYPEAAWPWLGFAAALAAVNADTWATELGVLSPRPPRLITNLRKIVEMGTSGGITLTGTLSALAGAAVIGALAGLLGPGAGSGSRALIVALAGLAGSLFDSLLGATVQAIYHCPVCDKETERHPRHLCGAGTNRIRGWAWMTNDWVNLACGAFGALMAILAGWG